MVTLSVLNVAGTVFTDSVEQNGECLADTHFGKEGICGVKMAL